jgi:hypothetical protein
MSEPKCAFCAQPIQGWGNVIFLADDLVAHLGCERSRKPLARLVPQPIPRSRLSRVLDQRQRTGA